ncbi:MAG: SMC family ATPase [Nanoarchaeota archaeon]|nr:SMC family ATPase [Nanoarchaeota archaeon]MBU4301098.1 SMC family ATPase [Nanoarchaeota archaeon]MBU4451914.1 SMC family ATPase [Nanoarchaeota archaeon]MCG2724601.1 SMC family ATPase [archaeon]
MIIKSLELENIRSYKKEKINFPEGIILFEGDIGSGKSTLLYAIEFALFGLGDLKSTFLLRNGEKEGSVALSMDIEGKDFLFRRTLERKKTGASQKECSIISGGSKTEFSPEEMKREVLKMLKFNENPSPKATSYIYRYAVFTPQESMKEILELPEDARLETLRRAFGIEEYRIARNNAAIVSKQIKERETFLAGSLEDFDALNSEKSEKSALFQKKSIELEEFSKKEKLFVDSLSEQRKKMDEFRAIKAVFDKISGELPRLKDALIDKKKSALELEKSSSEAELQIRGKKARISELELCRKPTEKTDFGISVELKSVRDKMTEISKAIGGLEKSISEAQLFESSLKSAEQEIENLDKKIALLEVKKKPTEKTGDIISREIQMLRKQADELREKTAVMKKDAKTFETLLQNEICPLCEHKIDPAHFLKKSRDVQEELEKLEVMLSETAAKECDVLKTRELLIEFSRANDAFESMSKERDMISKNLEAAKSKLDDIISFRETYSRNVEILKKLSFQEAELSKISESLKSYAMNQMKILEVMRETETLSKRAESERKKAAELNEDILTVSAEYESKQKEFESSKKIVSDIAALEKETNLLEDGRSNILRAISSAGAEMRVLEADLKAVDERLAKKGIEKKEKDNLCEIRTWLDEYFSGALATIEQHVLRSINEEFNSLFQKWFGILMVDTDLSVSINDAFTPLVVQNGYEQDIRALSGGEKTSVALAYRLALNTVVKRVCSSMSSSGLIILDEPTDGFSKEQLTHLRDVFAELACKQIILVSHERELEAFSDRVFKVVKEGSVSKVLAG